MMSGYIRRKTSIVYIIAALLPSLAGCASGRAVRVVKPGDEVIAGFTCRAANGEIAASTRKTAVQNPSVRKSAVFIMPETDSPVRLAAGMPIERPAQGGVLSFEEEIVGHLSRAIAGHTFGAHELVVLSDDDTPIERQEGHLLKMARVRKRPKELRMQATAYYARMGVAPLVGAAYTLDPAIPGTVKAVNGEEVVIAFTRQPGDVVDTPFGKGVIHNGGDMYEIVIDARSGDLVRSGPLVGRISEVNDREFTIDYSRPLAGETLTCDVELTAAK
jgi:hypothetical protein